MLPSQPYLLPEICMVFSRTKVVVSSFTSRMIISATSKTARAWELLIDMLSSRAHPLEHAHYSDIYRKKTPVVIWEISKYHRNELCRVPIRQLLFIPDHMPRIMWSVPHLDSAICSGLAMSSAYSFNILVQLFCCKRLIKESWKAPSIRNLPNRHYLHLRSFARCFKLLNYKVLIVHWYPLNPFV